MIFRKIIAYHKYPTIFLFRPSVYVILGFLVNSKPTKSLKNLSSRLVTRRTKKSIFYL